MQAAETVDLKKVCRKIIGIGMNYKDPENRLIEAQGDPLIFSKPVSTLTTDGVVEIPVGFNELIHEVELGVVIGKSGKFINEDDAMDHVIGYVLALDMTVKIDNPKDIQYKWLLTKGFDTATPISEFIPKAAIKCEDNIGLQLKVNGHIKQDGNTCDMLHKIPKLIHYISQYFKLEYGDLILTGTPLGNMTVKNGDIIDASLDDLVSLNYHVAKVKNPHG